MSMRIALTVIVVVALSGCRIVSEKKLAELRSPVNPHVRRRRRFTAAKSPRKWSKRRSRWAS